MELTHSPDRSTPDRALFYVTGGLLADVDTRRRARLEFREVLGGTISDDMIPLDRLRSQSPPVADAPAASQAAGAADQAPSAPAVAEPIDDADDVPAQPDDAGQDSPEG